MSPGWDSHTVQLGDKESRSDRADPRSSEDAQGCPQRSDSPSVSQPQLSVKWRASPNLEGSKGEQIKCTVSQPQHHQALVSQSSTVRTGPPHFQAPTLPSGIYFPPGCQVPSTEVAWQVIWGECFFSFKRAQEIFKGKLDLLNNIKACGEQCHERPQSHTAELLPNSGPQLSY